MQDETRDAQNVSTNENDRATESTGSTMPGDNRQTPDVTVAENIPDVQTDNSVSEVKAIEQKILKCKKQGEAAYLEIGKLLLQAKSKLKYGQWLDWLKTNVDISVCKAQRLMRVANWANEKEAPVPHLDFTKMYILSCLPKDALKDFLKGNPNIERMTKQEIKTAVGRYIGKPRNSSQRKSASTTAPPPENPSETIEDELRDIHERMEKIANCLMDAAPSPSCDKLRELCTNILGLLSDDKA